MTQKCKKCKTKIKLEYVDIDMAYSPMMGKCKKCGRETIKNFFKERREWCEEMNKKLENAGVNIFRYA